MSGSRAKKLRSIFKHFSEKGDFEPTVANYKKLKRAHTRKSNPTNFKNLDLIMRFEQK